MDKIASRLLPTGSTAQQQKLAATSLIDSFWCSKKGGHLFWSLELFYLSYLPDIANLYPIFHMTRWGMFLLPAAFSLLTHQFFGGKKNYYFRYIVLPCCFVSLLLCVLNTFVFPSTLKKVENGFLPERDLIYAAFALELAYAAISTAVYSIIRFKRAFKKDKQRMMWNTLPGVVFFFFGLGLSIAMGKNNYLSTLLGSIANISYISSVLYVTNQKSFMDFRKALSLSTSHTTIMLLILAMNAGLISALSGYEFSFANILIISAALAPAIVLYSKATKSGSSAVENIIYKNNYDERKVISDLSDSLSEATTLSQVTFILKNVLINIVKIKNFTLTEVIPPNKHCIPRHFKVDNNLNTTTSSAPSARYATKKKQFFFSDESPPEVSLYMEENAYEIIVPIFLKDQLCFLLCIGKTTYSGYFRQDDIAIFKWIQKELPQSIERIKKLEETQIELNNARKSLSMLSIMNQYHHDIKTPLAVIDGVVSTDIYDQEKQREIILEQVAKGTELISTMAGILRGERDRNITTLYLHDVIQHCALLFESRFEKIETAFSKTRKILGDEIDLKILFTNLIKNSTEASSPNKELNLSIKIWDDNNQTCISLCDTGTGMTKDQIDQIWKNNHSDKKTGNAIGLHVIKRIAEEHNANLSVKSKIEEGTTFELRFPHADPIT